MTTNRLSRYVFLLSTSVFAVAMLIPAVLNVVQAPQVVESLAALGYPAYFSMLLGLAKLAGVTALLVPVPHRVREWAYAGFTFTLLAAVASYVAVGQVVEAGAPLAVLVLLIVSYGSWRRCDIPDDAPRARCALARAG